MTSPLPFPFQGHVLVTGPSQAGKTRLTSHALQEWTRLHGTRGLVILDFAPNVRHGDRTIGAPLTAFDPIPDGAWHARLHAHAPRLQGRDEAHALELARENHERAQTLLATLPEDARALFVNDATIPYHHPDSTLGSLLEYADAAPFALFNALDTDAFGRDDAITRRERAVLERLRAWADHPCVLPLDNHQRKPLP